MARTHRGETVPIETKQRDRPMTAAAHYHIPAMHGEAVSMLGLISDSEIASLYGDNPFTIFRRRLRLGIPSYRQWQQGIRKVRLPQIVRDTISAHAAKRRSARQARS